MQIDTNDGTIVEGNIDTSGEVVMGISREAIAHITKLLTNLYNDPQSAVFREYLANALDAHTVAGVTTPVDIYLPTVQTPMFTVKDHGTGMSTETIKTIYSQYGESTKSSSNNEIGGFGLGCKSALAISSQFTVISTKDGVRTTAIISNSSDGIAKLNVVDVQESNEANGTQVAIPINDWVGFSRKAKKYFEYLPTGAIKVDGKINTNYMTVNESLLIESKEIPALDTTVNIFDTAKVHETTRELLSSGFVLVMGGIRYDIPYSDIVNNLDKSDPLIGEVFRDLMDNLVVVEAPIGSVKLSPQREGIQFNEPTKKYFNSVFLESCASYLEGLKKLIVDAPSFQSAQGHYSNFSEYKRSHVPSEYKDVPLSKTGNFYPEETMYSATFDNWSDKTRSTELSALSISRGGLTKEDLIVTGDVKWSLVQRYMASFMRSRRALTGTYPRVIYVGSELKLTHQAWHSRKVEKDDDGKDYRVFEALTDAQMEVFLDGAELTIIPYDDLKKEALAHRKAQRGTNPTSGKKDKTKYAILESTKGSFRGTSVDTDSLEIPKGTKVLYLSVSKESHEGVFANAVYCLTRGGRTFSFPDHLLEMMKETYGDFIVIFLTSGRKEEPLLKTLKSRGVTDALELDMDSIYNARVNQITSVTPEMYKNYKLRKDNTLMSLSPNLDDLKDRKLAEALSPENYETVRDMVLLYNNLPFRIRDTVTGVISEIESLPTWRSEDHPVFREWVDIRTEVYNKYPLLYALRVVEPPYVSELVAYMNLNHEESGVELFT